MKLWLQIAVIGLWSGAGAWAEDMRLATYNIEHFHKHFTAYRLAKPAATQPASEMLKELLDEERQHNEKDNWEVSLVLRDPEMNADILVLEECCEQKDLEYFNKRWLNGMYQTVIVFPGNSGYHQNVAMMLKPGFEVVERKDRYYLEKDAVANPRGDKLFARGPAFCLVRTPGGQELWVGVTHQKSKSGNSVEVSQWRNREATRTHEILLELAKEKQAHGQVILLGDMNDELGEQQFEHEAGGDAIAKLVGPAEDGLVLETAALAKAGEQSYGGYWRTKYRSLIDHIVVSKMIHEQVKEVKIFRAAVAQVASDHYPVVIQLHHDDAPAVAPATQPAPSGEKDKDETEKKFRGR